MTWGSHDGGAGQATGIKEHVLAVRSLLTHSPVPLLHPRVPFCGSDLVEGHSLGGTANMIEQIGSLSH